MLYLVLALLSSSASPFSGRWRTWQGWTIKNHKIIWWASRFFHISYRKNSIRICLFHVDLSCMSYLPLCICLDMPWIVIFSRDCSILSTHWIHNGSWLINNVQLWNLKINANCIINYTSLLLYPQSFKILFL